MKNKTSEINKRSNMPTNPLPNATTPPSGRSSIYQQLPGWILLPLRIFLGITFLYGGMQKLTDPQYFNPDAPGFIGKQIAAFATSSPLHSFLTQVVLPHAVFFGALVAYGEIAIGLGTLFGLLLRPAAFFGLLLNLMFFFSATWRVYPYFYGSDIVFIFCWLTLLLAGPLHSGAPTLDALFLPRLLERVSAERRAQLARVLRVVVGVGETKHEEEALRGQQSQVGKRNVNRGGRQAALRQAQETRRTFLWGLVTGGAGALVLAWLGEAFHLLPPIAGTTVASTPVETATPNAASTAGATAPNATSTAGAGTTIAHVSDVPTNSSVNFTIASNGDPGVLVHLNNGGFVAYDAVCTHAGCPVSYDPSSQYLVCPCHGAEFDPAKQAAVVGGPTSIPLTQVPINVDNTTGTITA